MRASTFGHNVADSTTALQAALDSTASTVIIDKVPGGWTTRPLFLRRSNVTVIVEPDVLVRSLAGGFPSPNDCLLTVADQSHVTISGYGATFAMNKLEYSTGEWRHALNLLGVQDTVVEGLTLRDSGGDGIYMGKSAAPYCQDVVVRDVVVANNRRNGMSVITVDGLLIDGCVFASSNGTPPQTGIDFEPNSSDARLSRITMQECMFRDNASGSLEAYLAHLANDSYPVSIVVDRTTFGPQVAGFPSFTIASLPEKLSGSIELRDSLLNVKLTSGAIGIINKSAAGPKVLLTRDTVWDWGNSFWTYSPIVIDSGTFGPPFPAYGGVTIADGVLVTDQPAPFLQAYDRGAGNSLTDLQGTITVTDPAGVTTDYGSNPQNVNLTVHTEQAGAMAPVLVRADRAAVTGGQPASLTFTRMGGDLSTPLAIAYETSGTARERYDYGGLGKVAVIPPGGRQVTVQVRTFPRRQATDPRVRSLIVTIAPGLRYDAPSADPARIVIG